MPKIASSRWTPYFSHDKTIAPRINSIGHKRPDRHAAHPIRGHSAFRNRTSTGRFSRYGLKTRNSEISRLSGLSIKTGRPASRKACAISKVGLVVIASDDDGIHLAEKLLIVA